MNMRDKMPGIVKETKLNILYNKRWGYDSSQIFDKKRIFWQLDDKETKYLVQEINKWLKKEN